MLNWHKGHCRSPDVVTAGETPFCSNCDAVPPEITRSMEDPAILPLPLPNPRDAMGLSWPSSVQYIDDDNKGDVNLTILGDLVSKISSTDEADRPDTEPPSLENLRLATRNNDIDSVADIEKGTAVLPKKTVYKELNRGEIRLLKVFAGSANEPIHCNFVSAHLKKYVEYEAISYTWADLNGNKHRNKPVYLGRDWSIVLVTANCYAALEAVRANDHDVMIWVDAICINQEDFRERTLQVAMMRDIYCRAARVIIFLGGDLSQLLQYRPIAGNGSNLLHHPYFSRVWVIQEIASASSAQIVYFSSHLDIQFSSRKAVRFELDWTLFCQELQTSGLVDLIKEYSWIFRFSEPKLLEQRELVTLLVDSLATTSSDPRDKIFALLGLIRDAEKIGLYADYSLSKQHVYAGVAAYAVSVLRDLTILKHAGIAATDDDLPSWVPKWKKNPAASFFETAKYVPLAAEAECCPCPVHRQTGALFIEAREFEDAVINARSSTFKWIDPGMSDHIDEDNDTRTQWTVTTWTKLSQNDRLYAIKGLDCPIILRPTENPDAFQLVSYGKLVSGGLSDRAPLHRLMVAWWAAIKNASNWPETFCQMYRDGLSNTIQDQSFRNRLHRICRSIRRNVQYEHRHWNQRLRLTLRLVFSRGVAPLLADEIWGVWGVSTLRLGVVPINELRHYTAELLAAGYRAGLVVPDDHESFLSDAASGLGSGEGLHRLWLADKQWLGDVGGLVERQRQFEAQLDEKPGNKPSEVTRKTWMVPPWLSAWLSKDDVSQLQNQLSWWRTSLEDQEENIEKWRTMLERGFRDIRHPDARFRSVSTIVKDEALLMDSVFKRWYSIMQVVERTEHLLAQGTKPEEEAYVVPLDSGWKNIAII